MLNSKESPENWKNVGETRSTIWGLVSNSKKGEVLKQLFEESELEACELKLESDTEVETSDLASFIHWLILKFESNLAMGEFSPNSCCSMNSSANISLGVAIETEQAIKRFRKALNLENSEEFECWSGVEDFEYRKEWEWQRIYRLDIAMSIATFSNGAFKRGGGRFVFTFVYWLSCFLFHVNHWIKLQMRSKKASDGWWSRYTFRFMHYCISLFCLIVFKSFCFEDGSIKCTFG